MKNKTSYFESTVDSNKVISQDGKTLLAHDSKGLLFWVDKYELLAKQDAKVDKYLINGQWYKQVDSVFCLDLRPQQPKQKLIESSKTRNFKEAYNDSSKTLILDETEVKLNQ